MLLAVAATTAQTAPNKVSKTSMANNLATLSVDSASDAAAIAKMRHKMDSIRQYRPTVAVVLAGGGAKGAAHIGALEYLEELGIPIDMVLGTSMGGLMGGLVSMGYSPKVIDSILVNTNWGTMLSDNIPTSQMPYKTRLFREKYCLRIPFHYEDEEWSRRYQEDFRTRMANQRESEHTGSADGGEELKHGFIANMPEGYLYGYNVYNIINSLTVGYQDSMDFCDLPIPYCCVATDLVSMKAKYWTHGRLVEAMRSTMSIPLYFSPVRSDGMVLVDGGTRNNFPTDMARAMGADYVIGVDLSQPRTYSEINGVGALLQQCIALMGKEAFDNNRPLADVYIHPDMTGMNMLSFDSKSIAECLSRGYKYAKRESTGLMKIREALGENPKSNLNNTPGINIEERKVVIGAITYDGISEDAAQFFASRSHITPGKAYGRSEIEEELSFMFGSSYFDRLSYSIYGDAEPYTLQFHCHRGQVHQFGAGLRADTRSAISAALTLGLNKNKISGFKADFSFIVGTSPLGQIDLSFVPLKGPSYVFSAMTRIINTTTRTATSELYNASSQCKIWRNHFKLYMQDSRWTNGKLNIGLDLDNYAYDNEFFVPEDISIPGVELQPSYTILNKHSLKDSPFSAFIDLLYDNTDDGFFPTHGILAKLDYRFVFHSDRYYGYEGGDVPYHAINAHVKGVIPIGWFAIIPSIYWNTTQEYNFANWKHHITDVSAADLCYVGGIVENQFFRNQIPYIGFVMPKYIDYSNMNAVANIDFRFQVGRKDYLTLAAAAFKSFTSLVNGDFVFGFNGGTPSDYAFALQWGHKAIFGPIRLQVNWSQNGYPTRWGCILAAGFDF